MGEEANVVIRLPAYRFAPVPDEEQRRLMGRFAGSCRFVFNCAPDLQNEVFKLCGFHPGYADICAELVNWKTDAETTWLNESPAQALQLALKNLECGWSRHFDSLKDLKQGKIRAGQLIGKPVFKGKGEHDSFRYRQGIKLEQENDRILLPKLGWVRYRNSREVLGAIKSVTVSQKAGKWFISIQTEVR